MREDTVTWKRNKSCKASGRAKGRLWNTQKEVERYLDKMRLLLCDQEVAEQDICISSEKLQEQLKIVAEQMASSKNMPFMIRCCKSDLVMQVNIEQMRRAWSNVLANALEYTELEQGIDIKMSEGIREGCSYLCAKVSDYGQGF